MNAEYLKRRYDFLTNSGNTQSLISMYQPFNEIITNSSMKESSLEATPLFPTSAIFPEANNLRRAVSSESFSSNNRPKKKPRKVGNSFDRFRPYQAEKWIKHFEELAIFRKQYRHCLVPHDFPTSPSLAGWVKRQRHQYKLFQKQKQSFMTKERIKILEDVGFVWDSHEATWHERLEELLKFKKEHGSCLVPSNYLPNLKLATWVKSQRRQYKLHQRGVSSNMSAARIKVLEKHGFEWEVRSDSNKITPEEVISGSDSSESEANSDELEMSSDELELDFDDGNFMDTLFDFLQEDSVFNAENC